MLIGLGILKFFIWGCNYVANFVREEEIELTKIQQRNQLEGIE